MKSLYYALYGACMCFSLLAVSPTEFRTLVKRYSQHQITRKELIDAYGTLEYKKFGDQVLGILLRKTIHTLRAEEARKEPETTTIPAPVTKGRPECQEKGCDAKRPRRHPQSPNARRRRPGRLHKRAGQKPVVKTSTAHAKQIARAQPASTITGKSNALPTPVRTDRNEPQKAPKIQKKERKTAVKKSAQQITIAQPAPTITGKSSALPTPVRTDYNEPKKSLKAQEQEQHDIEQAFQRSLDDQARLKAQEEHDMQRAIAESLKTAAEEAQARAQDKDEEVVEEEITLRLLEQQPELSKKNLELLRERKARAAEKQAARAPQ